MTDARPLVCLLRSPSADPDPYVVALEENGFRAECVPVLRFSFPSQEKLRARLAEPAGYGGLIVTSPRAVEALAEALRWLPNQSAAWAEKPAYAVGPRTAAALERLGFAPQGEASGSAEALASHLIRERDGKAGSAPLLFLSGNRRRGALPEALQEGGIAFEEKVVYETRARTDLNFSDGEKPAWLAFFSPSGIEAVQAARGLAVEDVKRAAIGTTTAAALEKAGWPADAVAQTPTPEALAYALRRAS